MWLTKSEAESMLNGTKIHHISDDYEHWYFYFNQVAKLKAYIVFSYWNETEWIELEGIKALHMQELNFNIVESCIVKDDFTIIKEFTSPYNLDLMAKNEGLSRDELNSYFKDYKLNQPFAIIHITDFRYK